VYVCREELYLKIQSANVMATSTDVNILDSISGLFGAPKVSKPRRGRGTDAD
jgi:hypothetical protein